MQMRKERKKYPIIRTTKQQILNYSTRMRKRREGFHKAGVTQWRDVRDLVRKSLFCRRSKMLLELNMCEKRKTSENHDAFSVDCFQCWFLRYNGGNQSCRKITRLRRYIKYISPNQSIAWKNSPIMFCKSKKQCRKIWK